MNHAQKVQHFYNQSSQLWLNTWGDQMHHGYYTHPASKSKQHRQAQVEMIEMLLSWGNIQSAQHILDLGCGVGGTTRYLSKKFDCPAIGYTISDIQADLGHSLTLKERQDQQVQILYGDVMKMDFPENSSDLVLAIESLEHMSPAQLLVEKVYKVVAVNGHFLIAAWSISEPKENMGKTQKSSLKRVCKALHIKEMLFTKDLEQQLSHVGFKNVVSHEITDHVVPFWKGVLASAFTWQGFKGLMTSGVSTLKGAWGVGQMYRAYRNGALKYVIYQAQK